MSSLKLNSLQSVCENDISAFFKLQGCAVGGSAVYPYGFIDNGGSILGVCHLDFVNLPFHYANVNLYDGLTVFCPRLDDRLGAFGLLYYLPEILGCSGFDILLTTGEESGKSSAGSFFPDKDYNWVFELDRRGSDAVTYDIQSKRFIKRLKSHDWHIGRGSFSDICELDNIGVCAVNFGIGYELEHSKLCNCNYSLTIRQFKKIAKFINCFKDEVFNFGGYKTSKIKSSSIYGSKWSWRDDYDDHLGYSSRFNSTSKIIKVPDRDWVEVAHDDLNDGDDDNDQDYLTGVFCAVCGIELNSYEVKLGVCDDCIG